MPWVLMTGAMRRSRALAASMRIAFTLSRRNSKALQKALGWSSAAADSMASCTGFHLVLLSSSRLGACTCSPVLAPPLTWHVNTKSGGPAG